VNSWKKLCQQHYCLLMQSPLQLGRKETSKSFFWLEIKNKICNSSLRVPYAALCKTFEEIEATTKR
jgi:hypothetical protein